MGAKSLSGTIVAISIVNSESGYFKFPLTFPLQFISQIGLSISARGFIGATTNLTGQTSHFRAQHGSLSTVSIISAKATGNFKLTGTIRATATINPITVANYIALSGNSTTTSTVIATVKGTYAIVSNIEAISETTGITSAMMALVGIIRANTGATGNTAGLFAATGGIQSISTSTDNITASMALRGVINSASNTLAQIRASLAINSSVSVTSTLNGIVTGQFSAISTCASTTSVQGSLHNLISGHVETDSNVGISQIMEFPLCFPFSFNYTFEHQDMAVQGTLETISNVQPISVFKSIKGNLNSTTTISAIASGIFETSGVSESNTTVTATIKNIIAVSSNVSAVTSLKATIKNNIALIGSSTDIAVLYAESTMDIASDGLVLTDSQLSGNAGKLIYGSLETESITKISGSLTFPFIFPLDFDSLVFVNMPIEGKEFAASDVFVSENIRKLVQGSAQTNSLITGQINNRIAIIGTIESDSQLLANAEKLLNGILQTNSTVKSKQSLIFPLIFPLDFTSSLINMTMAAQSHILAISNSQPAFIKKLDQGISFTTSNVSATISGSFGISAESSTTSTLTGNLYKSAAGKIESSSGVTIPEVFSFPWAFPFEFNYPFVTKKSQLCGATITATALYGQIIRLFMIYASCHTASRLTGNVSNNERIIGVSITQTELTGDLTKTYASSIALTAVFNSTLKASMTASFTQKYAANLSLITIETVTMNDAVEDKVAMATAQTATVIFYRSIIAELKINNLAATVQYSSGLKSSEQFNQVLNSATIINYTTMAIANFNNILPYTIKI